MIDRPAGRKRMAPTLGVVSVTLLLMGQGAFMAGAGAQDGPATEPDQFRVLARADAFSVAVFDESAPAVPKGQAAVFGSPSSAQSLVDSLGNSNGFASVPYPEEFATALPNTANGLGYGQAPPVPTYPFIVTSSYPGVPSAEETNGPYGITSKSTENASAADAHVAVVHGMPSVASSRAVTSASRNVHTGVMRARAESVVEGFSIGPALTIAEMSAHVDLSAPAGAPPEKKTSFSVGTMTVAGMTVGFTEQGFRAGPGTVNTLDLSAATEALAQAKITIEYLPASETPTSVRSAGLQISYTEDVPSQGTVTTTFTFGSVHAILEPGNTIPQEGVEDPAFSGDEGAPPTPPEAGHGMAVPTVGDEPPVGPVPDVAAEGAVPDPEPAASPAVLADRRARPTAAATAAGRAPVALPTAPTTPPGAPADGPGGPARAQLITRIDETATGVYVAVGGAAVALALTASLVGGFGIRGRGLTQPAPPVLRLPDNR